MKSMLMISAAAQTAIMCDFVLFIITNVFQFYHLQGPEPVPAILGGADACHACCKYLTYNVRFVNNTVNAMFFFGKGKSRLIDVITPKDICILKIFFMG